MRLRAGSSVRISVSKSTRPVASRCIIMKYASDAAR